MPETFLINVNCSKILDDGDETQYAMFIDSTKMSIVYELVEWIRWIFSLETCIYLTHGGLVIHELEDIKLLSEIKNFEVKPCGRSQCVHKRTYRTLLKNLDLFIHWNGMLVHKYFLHKLNQIDQKSSESGKQSPLKFTTKNTTNECFMEYTKENADKTKSIYADKLCSWESHSPKACTGNLQRMMLPNHVESEQETKREPQINSYFDKKLLQNFSSNGIESNSLNDSSLEFSNKNSSKNSKNIAICNENPENNNLEIYQEPIKNNSKPTSKKNFAKPFSLGELLSNLREGSEKISTDISRNSTNSFDMSENNYVDDGGRKRKRTRKRKKAKMQNSETEEFTPPILGKNNSTTGFDFLMSSDKPKPNHIRFEIENEENIMETDCFEDEQKTQPENSEKEITSCSDTSEFLKSDTKKFFLNNSQTLLEQSQDVLVSKNADNIITCSPVANPVTAEHKLIDLDDQICNNPCQVYTSVENFQENKSNPDLNMLLSLKEKCKNGVVIERFY